MTQLVAYVRYNGQCREAFEFYRDCLGGELTLQTVGDSPMAAEMGADGAKRILHASLVKDGRTIFGSDMVGPDYAPGNDVSLCLVCDSPEQTKTFFNKLSAGGQVTNALKEEFFGTFGDLIDKFGKYWMFQYSPTPLGT